MENSQYATYPSLKERVVLITGGATGIGASVVAHFARQGSRVTFVDVQDEPAQQLVDSLASEGCPKPHYIHCDITDLDALKAAVHQVLATHATIDVLVNNAANYDDRHWNAGFRSRPERQRRRYSGRNRRRGCHKNRP